ncbi:hypothetical protein K432DRAFT_387401 [Lepidopterella palustris CBS 459.81]|uniref:Uncharacterized protein n=1 Tax=Lepidopterella palustris CBS 459.81 TaxID=1314670 RepID=A0A8E2DXI1_9PEZI|nr:hypothetical protein K432DRAFT_387401 [Lepidopterella palustris CBS 459.81]
MLDLFNILLSDINKKVLRNKISTELGLAYLLETAHLTSPYTTVDGILFGRYNRVLFPLVVRFPRKSHSYIIHFVYGTRSPHTFLSKEACDKLFGTNPVPSQFFIQINSKEIQVNPPNADSHFEHVNLLGADFCAYSGTKAIINYVKRTATIHFSPRQYE